MLKKASIFKPISIGLILVAMSSCINSANNLPADLIYSPNMPTHIDLIDENIAVDTTNEIQNADNINQTNNIQYGGYVLVLNERIYFADGRGIHKTNFSFEQVETLVYNAHFDNDRYRENTAFGYLQHYNGRIYFLNMPENAIYSMYPNGTNLIRILGLPRYMEDGTTEFITEIIVVNGEIYFNHWQGSGVWLRSFNLVTERITDFDLLHTPILSLSPDGNSLQFNHEIGNLTRMNLKNKEVSSAMPVNLDELIAEQGGFSMFITYTTISGDLMLFGGGQRIYAMCEDLYARQILYIENGSTFGHVNAIDEWVYFLQTRDFEADLGYFKLHLYRVNIDGSEVQVVYENIVIGEHGWYLVFLYIVSEDIIMFKKSMNDHNIYAIVRNTDTSEFEMKHINPIS